MFFNLIFWNMLGPSMGLDRCGVYQSIYSGSFKIIVFLDRFGNFPEALEAVGQHDKIAGAERNRLAGVRIVADRDAAFNDQAFLGLGVLPFKLADIAGPDRPGLAMGDFLFIWFLYRDVFNCRHLDVPLEFSVINQ